MKKTLLLIYVLLSLPFIGEAMGKDEKLFNLIIKQHVAEQKKNQLNAIGTGGGIPDKITLFTLHFVSHKKVGIEEARRMIVQGAEMLLKRINNNKEIQPYLKNIPFKPTNLNYMIAFHDQNNNHLSPPYVGLVFIQQGKVSYCYHNPGELGFNSDQDKEEPYEEALRIVREEEKVKFIQKPQPPNTPENNEGQS